jgi:enoyl-CoA hydratase/carnithine racemase
MEAVMNVTTEKAQIRLTCLSSAYWRISFDTPLLNVMGLQFVREFREIISAVETDKRVKVLVFESAVEGFFLNWGVFLTDLKDLASLPQGPTGLEAWPDILVRITRLPAVSIALIRGFATGNGGEIAQGCDMSFASRENAVLSQWEVGSRLDRREWADGATAWADRQTESLRKLPSSDDIGGDLAEAYGYVNRSLPDSELDDFVDALASRIAMFDRWAIANTKCLVNAASLLPDVEIAAAGTPAWPRSFGPPRRQAESVVPGAGQRFNTRYVAFTGPTVVAFDVCLPFARRLSSLNQGGPHPAQSPILDHMVMEKRGRGMKQRHSDNDICDQSVPRIDAAHEFVIAEFRKVPKVEQRETMRKHIDDAQRDHDQQQQIEQPVRRHRGQVEDAAVKRRQSTAVRGAP